MIDGRRWIEECFGIDRCTKVAAFIDLVTAENGQQNLVAPSTVASIWERHALDSAQLLQFDQAGTWVDIGTGGGFPGMIVAILRDDPVVLVEPRRRRAAFLAESATALGLVNVDTQAVKAQHVVGQASVISARAVASVPQLLVASRHLARASTRWVLPRGKSGQDDLVSLRNAWQGVFHVEQSLSDAEAAILILDKVRPK